MLASFVVVGREQVVCASGSGGGTVDKVGEDDERDARVSSPQPGRRLIGGKVTGRRETGRKETGHRETGQKETRRKEMGWKTNGSKERGVGETVPVIGRRCHRYRNCRGMAINMLVEKLCREEEVGFVDLWGSFVGRADMCMRNGLHLSGKGAAVFADGLAAAVDSGMGSITNIFGIQHYLN